MAVLNVSDHPALAKAIAAQLALEAPKAPPYDPNHSPFGFVRLAQQGGGFACGVVRCNRQVKSTGLGEWKHVG